MKVAIIQYSTYGHIATMANAIKEGVEKSSNISKVDIYQVPETLSDDVLSKLGAPSKPSDIPVITNELLEQYDAFVFGLPTRFGQSPAQFSNFWDATGGLWAKGALYGKPAGLFVSTGTPGGGQEATIRTFVTYLVHHGMPYIPMGYGPAFQSITSFDEVHGGSPWGSGTFAGSDGSRQPNNTELTTARIQGEQFAKAASKIVASLAGGNSSEETKEASAPAKKEVAEKADSQPAQKDAPKADSEKAAPKAAPEKAATKAREEQSKAAAADSQSSCAKCIVM